MVHLHSFLGVISVVCSLVLNGVGALAIDPCTEILPVSDSQSGPQDQVGELRKREWQSVIWDGEKWVKKPQGKPIYLPTKPQGGTIITYRGAMCPPSERYERYPETKEVDTCFHTGTWKGLKMTSRPMCQNMTKALVATYSSRGCRPEKMKSLDDIPKVYMTGCADISDVGSMAFWCDGLAADQIDPPHDRSAVLKLLAIIIGSTFGLMLLMAAILGLVVFVNSKSSAQDGESFWRRFWSAALQPFGKKDGGIQL